MLLPKSSLLLNQSPVMMGDLYEILEGILYNLGIGVAATAMLSIAHSSLPLRMRK